MEKTVDKRKKRWYNNNVGWDKTQDEIREFKGDQNNEENNGMQKRCNGIYKRGG